MPHVGNIYSHMTLGDLLRKAVHSTMELFGQRGEVESCWCRRCFTFSVHSEPWCKRQDYYNFIVVPLLLPRGADLPDMLRMQTAKQ